MPPTKRSEGKEDKIAGVSSAAVAAKTGKPWAQWLTVLDQAGADECG